MFLFFFVFFFSLVIFCNSIYFYYLNSCLSLILSYLAFVSWKTPKQSIKKERLLSSFILFYLPDGSSGTAHSKDSIRVPCLRFFSASRRLAAHRPPLSHRVVGGSAPSEAHQSGFPHAGLRSARWCETELHFSLLPCCLRACVRARVCSRLCTREYGRQQTHAGSQRPAVKIHERTPAHSFPPGGQAVTFDLSSGKRQVSSPVTGGHVRTVVRPPPSHPSLLTLSSPSLPVSCTTLHLGCKPDRSKKNDERLFFLLLLLQLARLTSNFLQLFVSL